jgi:hypothetical protein
MTPMSEARRLTAIVLLFAIGFGLVALARAAEATWPLLLTPLPYAAIPFIVVNEGSRRSTDTA